MIRPVHEIAAEVIRRAGRDKPADAALREVLKSLRDLAPFDATEAARTVFIYYRWHVWLREERGVEAKMRLALRLNQRFQDSETSIPLSELRAKAVPAWTAELMEVSDDWLRSLQREPKLWLRAKRGTAAALAEHAGGFRERKVLAPVEAGSEAEIVLNWAFLVSPAALDDFRARLERLNGGEAFPGLLLQLSGPWPPYNFVTHDLAASQ